MASSPSEFLLEELTACWDQGYEALGRGDLDRVARLMEIAEERLSGLQPANADSPAERALRDAAMVARGRLEHGMRAGLEGVREELKTVRRGSKALSGYKDATLGVGGRVERDA